MRMLQMWTCGLMTVTRSLPNCLRTILAQKLPISSFQAVPRRKCGQWWKQRCEKWKGAVGVDGVVRGTVNNGRAGAVFPLLLARVLAEGRKGLCGQGSLIDFWDEDGTDLPLARTLQSSQAREL